MLEQVRPATASSTSAASVALDVPRGARLAWRSMDLTAARRLAAYLFAPVDISTLVFFRIAFGAIMLWEVWRYFTYNWIYRYYILPRFNFTYFGFEWVKPWPGDWMYVHFAVMGALAICIMLGLLYRVAAALFFLAFTYVFLLEQARYLNHFYMVCLVSFLMIFVPAHRAVSADAWCDRTLHSDTAPRWALWLLLFQVGIVYFGGGIAKLNGDWLRGEPLWSWLAPVAQLPAVQAVAPRLWVAYFFAYGGLLFDLLIVPALIWRRTRPLAFVAALAFNLTNAVVFQIGIFPWFMIAATLLFFSPDWPRRLVRRARRLVRPNAKGDAAERADAPAQVAHDAEPGRGLTVAQRLTLALLGLYAAFQIFMPLRHWLYPGDVSWTEEGHLFAWHMKLRSKSGAAEFFATDPATGSTWQIDPKTYLASWQYEKMVGRPDMILEFSHFLARELARQGYQDVEIRARVMASLNGRRRQLLVDPNVNLAAQPSTIWPATWIMPLTEPLPARDPARRG